MTKMYKDFYIYELNISGLAAAASKTDSFNIQADSDFRWEKATYWAHNEAAATNITVNTRIAPLVSILITDTGSGRQLMDAAVPLVNLFGIGEIPFILQQPKIFAARSTVSITLTNFDSALTYDIRMSFIGTKLFASEVN